MLDAFLFAHENLFMNLAFAEGGRVLASSFR